MRTIAFYFLIFSWSWVWKLLHPSGEDMPSYVSLGILIFSLLAIQPSSKSTDREDLGKLVPIGTVVVLIYMWQQFRALHVIPETLYLIALLLVILMTQRMVQAR